MNRPHNHGASLSRRALLVAAGSFLAGSSLLACDLLSTTPEGRGKSSGTGTGSGRLKEAPEFTEAAKSGSLPPLKERLPDQPLVLDPLTEVGRYGGDLNLVQNIGARSLEINTTMGYENLLRWKPGATSLAPEEVVPNVAADFEVTGDGSEYVFYLRKGMKWSDGEAFTADDIVFWYEGVLINEELSPGGVTGWLDTGGSTPLVVEKVDDHALRFRFSNPNGLFTINLATQRGTDMLTYPAHYLKEFHKEHSPDVVERAKEEGFDDWVQLFQDRHDISVNPALPTLNAWAFNEPAADAQRPVAVRNPYYWKTDPEGRQLPYLDRVVFQAVNSDEAGILKIANGEADMVTPDGMLKLSDKPVLAKTRETGGYRFYTSTSQRSNRAIVFLNLTHEDPVLRDVFRNNDLRVGLSYAINRQEVIDTVFVRQGIPRQAAPREGTPYYNERLATQYTEFDPEKAATHLDKALPEMTESGLRLRPDGKPLRFLIDAPLHLPWLVDVLELIKAHWAAVGVSVDVNPVDASLFFERMSANTHDAATYVGGGGLGAMLDPFDWVPHNSNTLYAIPWYRWHQDPDDPQAETPPPTVRDQIGLYKQLLETVDPDEQVDLMGQITDIGADEFYCIGTVLLDELYGVFSTRLANTPQHTLNGWLHAELAPSNPQQYFIQE